jgi:hypothetical protein
MKKAIAIIFFGLLLPSTGNALSQDQAINKYLSDRPLANIEGIFKSTGKGSIMVITKTSSNNFTCVAIRHEFIQSGNSHCNIRGNGNVYRGTQLAEVNGQLQNINVMFEIFNGSINFTAIDYNASTQNAYVRIWPTDIDSHNANLGGNNLEMISMIDKAKDTCKSLGFTEGTDKFADCSLTLYSQSVELAAKNNQQIVVQGQSSGSNVMTIYDPVRDSNAAIKRGQGLINGTCTLGDLSTC